MLNIIAAHKTEIALLAGWLFSAVMSSMPPVDPATLTFPERWLLSFLQFLAANIHRV